MQTLAHNADSEYCLSPTIERESSSDVPGLLPTLGWMYQSSRRLHPGQNVCDLRRAATLFLRQLAVFGALRRWRLEDASALRDTLAWRPSLVSVVQRPYISTAWDAARRVTAIEEHYRQVALRAPVLRLGQGAAVPLATIESRGSTLEVVLDSPAWFIHEGEVCLNLFHAGERIYTLAFSIGFDAGEPVAYVGALQGSGTGHALDLYRTLTSALHGLRPRELLLAVFRMLLQGLGMSRWVAVGDGHRVSDSAYFGAAARLHTSYDEVWSMQRGTSRPDGFYDLPVDLPRRVQAEIPSRKRSAYRQRYDMLDKVGLELAQAIRSRGTP